MTERSRAAAAPPRQRLSTAQMIHLMRLEIDQALRHHYPISCMVAGLDGYEGELAGHRRAIMPAVFQQLKEATFASDVRGLGVWTNRYQLAVFPHMTPEMIAELGAEMLRRAANVPLPAPDAPPVTLCVGISHNLHPGPMSFETLVEEAETGMGLAAAGGGNRVVQARDVETEIDRLRDELEHQIADIQRHQEELFGEESGLQESWARDLIAGVVDLFEREPEQSEGVLRLKKEVIALVKAEVQRWRDSSTVTQLLQSQGQIERLERRVHKLTESLGVTEEELKRIAAAKSIDLGISSLYRTVQGLDAGDAWAEAKRAMLECIFAANLALQGKAAAERGGEK
ncbi:MAG: hypothetical protein AB1726_15600 [Planctomycetota bacterium]